MAKLTLKKASTDVTVYVFIQASNVTTGAGLTGLVYNTSSLVASYVRPLGSRTAITLATQTVTGAHSDGGFVEVDATNMPGVYRLDLPDAVCATGVGSVVVMLKGAANMAPLLLEIQLTDFDLNSTSNAVGAAASVTAGVTLADDAIKASKFDESTAFPLKSADTGTTQVARVGADSDTLETLSDQLDMAQADLDNPSQYKADVSGIPAAVWGYATRTLSSFGTLVADIWGYVTRTLTAFGFTVATNSDANVIAIKGKTDNLPANTATTLSAIQADLDNPNQYKADVSGLATQVTANAIKAKTDNLPLSPAPAGEYTAAIAAIPTTPLLAADYTAPDNAGITAIKTKTDNLPVTPAPAGEYTAAITAIQSDLDNPDQYKADVSGLALEATLNAIKGEGWLSSETLHALKAFVDEIETRLTAARAGYLDKLNVTGTLAHSNDANTYKADVSGLATATALAAAQADLDNPNQYKADVSGIPAAVWSYATRTLSSFGTLVADIWAHATRTLSAFGFTVATNSDANVTAIKNKTDNLPASPAPASEYDAELAAIQADLNNPAQYKADVSGLMTAAGYTAPDNAGIADIKAKTDQMTFTIPGKIDASATIDTTGIATSAELEEVDNKVGAIKAKTDLMDASAITYVTAIVGTTITILRGDTFTASITDIGSLADYVSIDFTVKSDKLQTDDEATIRIRKNASGVGDGLLRLNGAAPTTETGSITIDDEAAGDITITLDETATKELSTGSYSYDVQLITATAVKTLTAGKLIVTSDVTRAIA